MRRKVTQYRTIDTSTLKGLKAAERLYARGWKIGNTGLFSVTLYKKPETQTTK